MSRYVSAAVISLLPALVGCEQDSAFAGPGGGLGSAECFTSDEGTHNLLGAPLLFSPTSHGFGVSAILRAGDLETLHLRLRPTASSPWTDVGPPTVRASDLAEWTVDGLEAGTRYEYQVTDCSQTGGKILYANRAITQRPPGQSFTFALVSDTHIGSDLAFDNQGDETVLSAISGDIAAAPTDFVVNLGDILDYHQYGFLAPPPTAEIARQSYVNYRNTLGDLAGSAFHYPVIGGWDSENGCDTADVIDRSRSQRLLYWPSPGPATYPEGGSAFEDYYAFTWGDALFIVLNVFSYTPTCHSLGAGPGLADDWTLGQAQLDWFRQTLANAQSKWKVVLIHHPVGGNAGDDINSAYGRGGGRAAHVGEQEMVHELMKQYGVQIFFYGHDHVFTDMLVDGIHYTLPGSAGAPWKFVMAETGYDTFWPDSGWGRVDVTPDEIHVQFIPMTGAPLFDYTVR